MIEALKGELRTIIQEEIQRQRETSNPHDTSTNGEPITIYQKGKELDSVREKSPEDPIPEHPALYTREGRAFYSLAVLARYFGLSRNQIFKLSQTGKIEKIQPAHDLFLSFEDVQRYIETPKNKGGRPRKLSPDRPVNPQT